MTSGPTATAKNSPEGPTIESVASPPAANPRPLRGYGWRVLLLGLLSYAFIFDNSTSIGTAEGYRWTRLVALPRELRVVEILAIGLVAIFVASRRVSRLSAGILMGCATFIVLTLVSYAIRPIVGWADFLRLVYMYLLPSLVFVVARESRGQPEDLYVILRFVTGWVLVSAAVSWVQFVLGYPIGDDITGLSQDAHANATLMMLVSFVLVAQGLVVRNRKQLLLSMALMATAVLSSALKIMLIGAVILAGIVLLSARGRGQSLARMGRQFWAIVVLAILLSLTYQIFTMLDVKSADRLGGVLEGSLSDPTQMGPVTAHLAAFELLGRRPLAFLVGYGPFSYANPISMGQTRNEGPLASHALAELRPNEGESGENARATLTTSLVVEFGLLAFLVQAAIVITVLFEMWKAAQSRVLRIRAVASGAGAGVVLLLAIGFFSLFNSITVISVSWSVMILAGLSSRVAAAERLRGLRTVSA